MKALHLLDENASELERDDPRLPVALAQVRDDNDLPFAWTLRRQRGDSIPEPIGDDELERGLAKIARDSLPVLLSPPDLTIAAGPGRALPAAGPLTGLNHVVTAHPEFENVSRGLTAEGLATDSVFRSPLTVVDASQAPDAAQLMEAAARRFRHSGTRDADELMALALSTLRDRRRLVAGESILVPAWIGFSALPFSAANALEIPQGLLRPAGSGEQEFAPLSFKADAVLETTTEGTLYRDGTDESPSDPHATGQERLNRLAREVVLATALGSPDPVPKSCPAVAWIVEQAPFEGGGAQRPLTPAETPRRNDRLTSNELGGLRTWANKIDKSDLATVEIAVDRLLRALWELEWTDSLIDAVVAWENLVGTRSETSFRVTASCGAMRGR